MSDLRNSDLLLLDVPDLTDDRALIADSIARFGAGEHPVPEGGSLDFFRLVYAQECVARAREAGAGDIDSLAAIGERLLQAIRSV